MNAQANQRACHSTLIVKSRMTLSGFGYGLDSLDHYIIGVGIGAGAVVVTLRDDAPYYVADSIPTELTDSFEGLPIDIEYSGGLVRDLVVVQGVPLGC